MDTPILHGRFVDLRPLVVDDAATTLAWRLGSRARLLNQGAIELEQQVRWISSRPSDEHNFVIALKNGLDVGMLSLTGISRGNRHGEPGRFLIGAEEAVRGVPAALEAMKLLYGFAFDDLGLVRVWGLVAEENRRMLKWQKYLGMREEGRLRRHYFMDGRFQDAIVLGLLADEYRAATLPKMEALIALGERAGTNGGTTE
jgi:diamine N-acetyltransferase